MPKLQKAGSLFASSELKALFADFYHGDEKTIQHQLARYQLLLKQYQQNFGDADDAQLFSAPGRIEIGGNHTDHNHGRVLAASINLDALAVAARRSDHIITLWSDGFPEPFVVDLKHLVVDPKEAGTTAALMRGIAARCQELDFQIGGFNACVTSEIAVGSGLSSSAAFEVLIATILNYLYNEGLIPPEIIAPIGQYSENIYFGKPCGLMDQLAVAVGGIVTIDFRDAQKPFFKKVDFDFDARGYSVIVVNTGGSHADLTEEYAAIPHEMKSVARALGKNVCREIAFEELLHNISMLRSRVGDRALLRAWHFLEENARVEEQVRALEQGDFAAFLRLVNDSGNSSNKWLQNIYPGKAPSQQGINLALALTEAFLKKVEAGACRVHGGGFAGTIQVFLPNAALEEYYQLMRGPFGEHAISVLKIRTCGAMKITPC